MKNCTTLCLICEEVSETEIWWRGRIVRFMTLVDLYLLELETHIISRALVVNKTDLRQTICLGHGPTNLALVVRTFLW
jgi:hypothetical protein